MVFTSCRSTYSNEEKKKKTTTKKERSTVVTALGVSTKLLYIEPG